MSIGAAPTRQNVQPSPTPAAQRNPLEELMNCMEADDPSSPGLTETRLLLSAMAEAQQTGGFLELGFGAQPAFEYMIRQQQFDVFALLFEEYHRLCSLDNRPDSITPPRELRLCLPPDWRVAEPAAMVAAFSQIQVETLVVDRPAYSHDGTEEQPAALSPAIVCLLNGGLAHLILKSPLAEVESVASAIEQSRLTTAELQVGTPLDHILSGAHLKAHNRLLSALAKCSTLTALRTNHGFHQANASLTPFLAPGGAQLTELQLALHDIEVDDAEDAGDSDGAVAKAPEEPDHKKSTTEIAKTISQFPAMGRLTLSVDAHGGGLLQGILQPLQTNTRRLRELTLSLNPQDEPSNTDDIDGMNNLLIYAATCGLTRVNCDLGRRSDTAIEAIAHLIEARADERRARSGQGNSSSAHVPDGLANFDDLGKLSLVAELLASDTCQLAYFKLSGAFNSKAALNNLFKALKKNTTLIELDMDRSYYEASASNQLFEAIETNLTLRNAYVSTDPRFCYLETADHRVHLVDGSTLIVNTSDLRNGEGVTAIHALANQTFAPLQSRHARLQALLETQLAHNQQVHSQQVAFQTLGPSLRAVLDTAANGVPPSDAPKDLSPFTNPILQHLLQEFDTKTAVHLNEVNTAADTRTQRRRRQEAIEPHEKVQKRVLEDRRKLHHERMKRHQQRLNQVRGYSDLKTLSQKQLNRVKALVDAITTGDMPRLQRLISQGLELNTVFEAIPGSSIYVNSLLDIAMQANNEEAFHLLKSRGAIDFEDRVGKAKQGRAQFFRDQVSEQLANASKPTPEALAAAREWVSSRELTDKEAQLMRAALIHIEKQPPDRMVLWNFIQDGLRLNAVDDKGGNILLQAAVQANNADLVGLLLDHGAEDYLGLALAWATNIGKSPELIRVLSE